MLKLLVGTDWIANRDMMLHAIANDVSNERGNRILLVPELITHDTERRLAACAGYTCSRFAEVLSFTRLVNRVSEWISLGPEECLDNGGRVVAMAAATRMLHSKLKAYASLETKPEFLTGLVDAVDEFKRCCITAEDLLRASKASEGSFAQKLEELSYILETYDSICLRGKRDPRDQMTWLLEQLEDSDFAENHVFYIDGFPDFTRQNMAIVSHLMENSPEVIITMNCDKPGSKRLAFEKAGDTMMQLIKTANDLGVETQVIHVPGRQIHLAYMQSHLFQGSIDPVYYEDDVLQVYRTETVYQECLSAAQKIQDLVKAGYRYRDICVVCADMESYRNTVEMVLRRCKIPVYQSGTDDILEKSVIYTVLSALDVALGGFEQKDVLRYLRSMLSPVEPDLCDKLENYSIMWSISGNQWKEVWTKHPVGLGEVWNDAALNELQHLDNARRTALEPLISLQKRFRGAVNLKQQVQAVYTFLEEIQLAPRLSHLAGRLDRENDNRNAQILNQLWDILLTALEQMYDVLGDTVWEEDAFCRVFRLLLGQYDVGTIPPVLDAVIFGPVSAMRCQQSKHLIVLGALEGNLPAYTGSAGVLTDTERVSLRNLGVPLTGGAMEGLQAEFAEIYGVFCGAESSVSVFCPSGQPSFVYRRLLEMAGRESVMDTRFTLAQTDATEAAAYLTRYDGHSYANALGIEEEYAITLSHRDHNLGNISKENVALLYGDRLNLSASQIDRQAECRLSYFLKYGMRAKERKPITVDPAEFGTYVHAVLELTVKRIMELGGFSNVSVEDALTIADEYAKIYADEHFGQLDSQRMDYLFRRNSLELSVVVRELWNEMRESSFLPVAFELAFGKEGDMDAIQIPARNMQAQLLGVVDRVDLWQSNGRNYFRVVDYKTGRKDFDYCDVFNGIGLQMLLYLFALENEGAELIGDDAVPAGVQYFPARAPLVSADGSITEDEAEQLHLKGWKRKGLLLCDEDVLHAMEPADKPVRLCFSRKKDGSISGDLADRQQFRLLKSYVFALLGNLVDTIASGCVEANPYTRGSSHNACTFCPYSAVCHPAMVEGRRDYKTMSSQRFWDEVEKEMSKNG